MHHIDIVEFALWMLLILCIFAIPVYVVEWWQSRKRQTIKGGENVSRK